MKKIQTIATVITGSLLFTLPFAVQAHDHVEEVLVSASLVPIAATRSANAITVIDIYELNSLLIVHDMHFYCKSVIQVSCIDTCI